MHIEEPLNEVPRLQQQHEDENKTKTNVTPEAGDMTSANQTPGGYKFAPLLAINNQLQVLYGVCKAAEMCVCVCVCVFIKLHITAQSSLVILVILCHSH